MNICDRSHEKKSTARDLAVNSCVVLVSSIVSYLLIEIIFFRVVFPSVTIDVHPYLPETAGVLAQTSKSAFVPRDYIAILGDSYAEGVGDGLLAAGENARRVLHAAHVVRDLTGRDVVSFGRGGSSNAESFVRQPARVLAGSRCHIFPTIAEPREIFVYFYEGNDLQDNLRFAQKVVRESGRADGPAVDGYLVANYVKLSAVSCHLYLFDVAARMTRFLYQYYYLGVKPLWREAPGGNLLRVDDRVIDGPAPLEGPGLELDDRRVDAGLTVLDRSLAWLRARFPRLPITVVYIPAPLSTYQLTGSSYVYAVEPREEGKTGRASPTQIAANTDRICNFVRLASERHGMGFFDTRPALRQAGAIRLLHGPADWGHFNEHGYRALGALLARRLDDLSRVDACN